jgi:uncharacterized protein YebE (UPF0316 family)
MKTYLIIMIMLCMIVLSSSYAVTLTKESQTTSNKEIIVKLVINNSDNTKSIDVAEFLPAGWHVTNWTVTGISGDKITIADSKYMDNFNIFHWALRNIDSKNFVIEYSTKPQTSGNFRLASIWFYPGGFNMVEDTINVFS